MSLIRNKNFHAYLLCFSLFFLVVSLYKADYLKIPYIYNPTQLILSFGFLFSGFFLNSFAIYKMFELLNYDSSIRYIIAAIGMNIFAKYVPGKMWIVVGRAAYLSRKMGLPSSDLSLIFLYIQFVFLLTGLIIGIIGLAAIGSWGTISWVSIPVVFFLIFLIFSDKLNLLIDLVLKRIFKKSFVFQKFSMKIILYIIPYILFSWLLWGIGFYLLASALTSDSISLTVLLCFPLSATIGMISVFAPGGIGVREGIMVVYLTAVQLNVEQAIIISAASRLWFLIGEFFIFIVGNIADRNEGSKKSCP